MAKALFCTDADIKKFTAMNGNIDADKFTSFIYIAQQTHIQNYLGTDLYNKINDDIVSQTISGIYLSLLNDYVKPMTIYWAFAEFLPFSAYTIGNKGVYKHGSENSETATKEEVDFLVEKTRDIAQHYTQRFIDYMCENYTNYPEYTSNTDNDIKPDKNNTFNGWYF